MMLVCEKGHQISSRHDREEPKNKYCTKCGAKIIGRCPSCHEQINGKLKIIYSGIIDGTPIQVPNNCHSCGKTYPWSGKNVKNKTAKNQILDNPDEIIQIIFERIHDVIKQINNRYNNRPTIKINDEYDIQDILHCLLRIFFDDIRPEEWNPSYGGRSTRSDFLIKKYGIIIEVKYTKSIRDNKQLKEQLIIDKEQYKNNQNCLTLWCLVYDPDEKITNPRGFEEDLEEITKKFKCKVLIVR